MPEQSPTRFTMVPARRSNEPTARKRARRIINALFLAAALSVIAVFVALAKGQARADYSGVDPQGRDLAYTAAVNHLSGNPQNVPHVDSLKPDDTTGAAGGVSPGTNGVALPYRSLSWVGFTPQHFGSKKAGYTDFEVHHFLVLLDPPADPDAPPSARKPVRTPRKPTGSATPAGAVSLSPTDSPSPSQTPSQTPSPAATPTDGPSGAAGAPAANVLQLDVTVLLTSQGPRLAAVPAFSVWTGGAGGATGKGDYTNYNNLIVDTNDATQNQVAQWARAYVSGDSARLLALTGDQDSGHRYVGLSGFTLPDSNQAVQIISAIKAGKGQLVVRTRVALSRAVADRKYITYADFDLLIGDPAGAQPPVLAWGPAGSAAQLEPYSNALTR